MSWHHADFTRNGSFAKRPSASSLDSVSSAEIDFPTAGRPSLFVARLVGDFGCFKQDLEFPVRIGTYYWDLLLIESSAGWWAKMKQPGSGALQVID
jgi:hypothetical protein